VEWTVHAGDYQWDLPDDTRRYYVPDIAVIYPGKRTAAAQREAIAMVVEVTSPSSADTVYNDRTVKPKQYAKGRISFYLLVDQELASSKRRSFRRCHVRVVPSAPGRPIGSVLAGNENCSDYDRAGT
jgi:Putative restriction endonuclease